MSQRPHPSFFDHAHLPEHLAAASAPFAQIASKLAALLPVNAESDMAIRKILEAKDCAVRSVLLESALMGEPEEQPQPSLPQFDDEETRPRDAPGVKHSAPTDAE